MRLSVLDHGHRGRSRLWVGMLARAGADVDILKALHHRPAFFGRDLARLVDPIMRGPSAWTVGEREFFAAWTSRLNQCPFCAGTHAAVASLPLGPDVVEAVWTDAASAPVSDRVRAGLTLVERFTVPPDGLDRADVEAARAAGLSDADIADVVDVATLFNFVNRLADAFGFRVPGERGLPPWGEGSPAVRVPVLPTVPLAPAVSQVGLRILDRRSRPCLIIATSSTAAWHAPSTSPATAGRS